MGTRDCRRQIAILAAAGTPSAKVTPKATCERNKKTGYRNRTPGSDFEIATDHLRFAVLRDRTFGPTTSLEKSCLLQIRENCMDCDHYPVHFRHDYAVCRDLVASVRSDHVELTSSGLLWSTRSL